MEQGNSEGVRVGFYQTCGRARRVSARGLLLAVVAGVGVMLAAQGCSMVYDATLKTMHDVNGGPPASAVAPPAAPAAGARSDERHPPTFSMNAPNDRPRPTFSANLRTVIHEDSESLATTAGPRSELPMRPSLSGMPVVTVTGPSGKQWRMLVDTGAYAVMVSPELAAEEAFEIRKYPLMSRDAGGRVSVVPGLARCSSITVGVGHYSNFDVVIMSRQERTLTTGGYDGVLGLPLFYDTLLTFDFPKDRLIMELGDLPPPDGHDVLPLRIDSSGHALVPVCLAGNYMWAVLDTGFTSGIAVPSSIARDLPGADVAIPGAMFMAWHGVNQGKVARIAGDLQIGQYVIHRPPADLGISRSDVILGTKFLQYFSVTIDQRNHRVRFTRRRGEGDSGKADVTPIDPGPVETMGFTCERRSGHVVEVLTGSGAEMAGIRIGDTVISVTARTQTAVALPAPTLSLQPTWPKASTASTTLPSTATSHEHAEWYNVLIARDGKFETIAVPVTTLIP